MSGIKLQIFVIKARVAPILWYAQSLLRIRGSDTCSGHGLHHADQTVTILAPDAHRVRLGFAASTSFECWMPEPLSCCPPLAINWRIGSGLVAGGGLELQSQRSDYVDDGRMLGVGQPIVQSKHCECLARLQKCLDFFSYDRRFHGNIPFMHAAHADMKAHYFSLGYLGFEARRSSLSNAQIMTNASPAPVSTSNTGTFASSTVASIRSLSDVRRQRLLLKPSIELSVRMTMPKSHRYTRLLASKITVNPMRLLYLLTGCLILGGTADLWPTLRVCVVYVAGARYHQKTVEELRPLLDWIFPTLKQLEWTALRKSARD